MMNETILLGRDRDLVEIPRQVWESHLAKAPEHAPARLAFMTEAHHRVRYFVVRELPRLGKPIPPALLAQELRLPLTHVQTILDELEQNLFFLVRNGQGAVVWAFPVTAEPTPHPITFSSGERLYAA